MQVTGAFTINGDADLVFTMFDPEGEARWAPGWKIDPVFPMPFRPQANAVFRVVNDGQTEVWSMLEFNPRERKVEYLATAGMDLVRRVSVSCVPVGRATEVSVTYVLTSLSPVGAARAARFDAAYITGWRELVQAAVDKLKTH
jgi:hypothetical protein